MRESNTSRSANDNGEWRPVRVDDRINIDQVGPCDPVKVQVSGDGYASTIQRVAE
jgi:hypothetical protein